MGEGGGENFPVVICPFVRPRPRAYWHLLVGKKRAGLAMDARLSVFVCLYRWSPYLSRSSSWYCSVALLLSLLSCSCSSSIFYQFVCGTSLITQPLYTSTAAFSQGRYSICGSLFRTVLESIVTQRQLGGGGEGRKMLFHSFIYTIGLGDSWSCS